jgi:CRP/FNR family cyclic AMP-dependent transcriptional regulator
MIPPRPEATAAGSEFTAEIQAAVQAGPLAEMSTAVIVRLVTPARRLRLSPGRALREDDLCLLLDGRIAISLEEPDGRSLAISFLNRGSIVGLDRFLGCRLPTRATAVATVDALHLSTDALRHAAASDPEVGWALAAALATYLESALGNVRVALFGSLRQRVARHLLMLSIGASRPVRHAELARYAGASREAVSRTVASLRAQRIVGATDAGIVILDQRVLRELAAIEPDHHVRGETRS